jgi:regulator of sigma E protease
LEHHILAQFGLEGIESFLRAILFFVIAIFVLVTVHEFGHFIAGRIFGMRVPVFSIGMGRRLFGFNKLNGFTLGPLDPETETQLENNTDYRLSVLPIGGYAKIEGMIDETQSEALPEEMQPWEFRAKPWWQKSIVISAGVIMNTILAWGIFSAQNYFYGDETPATTTIGYVSHGSVSETDGVRAGDKIVAIDGKKVSNWLDVDHDVTDNFGRDFSITIDRGGKLFSALYRSSDLGNWKDVHKRFGLDPLGITPPVIDSVTPGHPAAFAGLMKGRQHCLD